MKVLVTGGKGFIGSWVVRGLLDKGILPVVYDLPEKSFLLPGLSGSVEMFDGDVTDRETLTTALRSSGASMVVHTAALTNVEKTQSQPRETIQTNVQGTLNVLEAVRESGIHRVVYTSSRGVFGHIEDRHGHPQYELLDETYRCRPQTIYGATKFFSECLGANYARMYGIHFCSLRFSMIYGPGKRPTHGSGAYHSILIEESLAGRPVVLPKGADQKDDVIYVRDVAQAIVRAVLAPGLPSPVYLIGTGTPSTPVDFALAIKDLVPQSRIHIGPGLDYLDRGYQNYCIFNISQARKDLGYSPEFGLHEGIRDYLLQTTGPEQKKTEDPKKH